jgi:hypothetical protein
MRLAFDEAKYGTNIDLIKLCNCHVKHFWQGSPEGGGQEGKFAPGPRYAWAPTDRIFILIFIIIFCNRGTQNSIAPGP